MVQSLYTGTGKRPAKELQVEGDARTEDVLRVQRDPSGYRLDQGEDHARVLRGVNVALSMRMPLLISGEPGSGKTLLGYAVAHELGKPEPFQFDVKSQSTARELFYDYDAVGHFRAAQTRPTRTGASKGEDIADPRNFIEYAALGIAILLALPRDQRVPFLGAQYRTENGVSENRRALNKLMQSESPRQTVVVIDEVDKAPPDFPNDLLHELETMSFRVPELKLETGKMDPTHRPIVFITSNSERQLPEAFLRRCAFVPLKYPEGAALENILASRLSGMYEAGDPLMRDIQAFFEDIRKRGGFSKPPGTAELIQFLMAAQIEGADRTRGIGEQREKLVDALPLLGKSEFDTDRLRTALEKWRPGGASAASV